MGSQAGLNIVGSLGGVPMLAVTPASTAVTPLPAYGAAAANIYSPGVGGYIAGLPNPVIGNDSGIFLTEAKGFTKWVFQLLGSGTGYTVTILGTIDPYVQYTISTGKQNPQSPSNLNGNYNAIPATSWFVLPSPADQVVGGIGNPLVSGGATALVCSLPLTAVRAVLTAVAAPAGSAYVVGMAVP